MNGFVEAARHVASSPLFGLTLTVAVYLAAVALWKRAGRHALLTPAFVAIVVLATFLVVTGIPYEQYMIGGSYLNFLLGPATVALAVPLHRAAASIRQLLLPIAVGVAVGAVAAMVTAILTVRLLGGDPALEATLAPKSATTPISMALAAQAGGNAPLTAVLTILTGVVGAVLGPWLLGLCRIRDPRIRGLAIGVSSHGIGTARALADGPLTGAFAALAMALSGVVTAVLIPLVMTILG